ncbi:hypothetical protein BFP71_04610 [Roseivirga misakiensis]|uniref:HTH araC/xylS-type domain-containing protein n=2 Tax=Roseivirga misakiensis TaxID=1563681 RepID=A0A1E5T6C9_9BACT|nr:hypothetical protein BFP71_04610 [Roseivirga misakiensis]
MADNQCGIVHKKTNRHTLDNHRLLSSHAITLVLQGALNVHSDDSLPLKVEANQMVLLPAGLYAITDIFAQAAGFEAIVFFFNSTFLDDYLGKSGLMKKSTSDAKRAPYKLDLPTQFGTFAKQTLSIYLDAKADNVLATTKMHEAFNLLIQTDNSELISRFRTLNTSPKKDLDTFMKAHYDKPLAVEDYATLSGRSVSTFRRAFHHQFGTSPKSWLIKQRLEKSRKLLVEEDIPIVYAAQLSGFNDVPHFIKTFQKQYNITPKQYALTQVK